MNPNAPVSRRRRNSYFQPWTAWCHIDSLKVNCNRKFAATAPQKDHKTLQLTLIMKSRSYPFVLLGIVCAPFCFTGKAVADSTIIWQGTTGGSLGLDTALGWNETAIWDSTTFATISKDFSAAIFTLDGSKTIHQLTYNDTGASGDQTFTLNTGSGGTLSFAGTNPTITANAAMAINAPVDLASGLTKAGSATLTLSGTVSNYTTGSANLNTVTAGTLAFGASSGVSYNWSAKTAGAGLVQFNANAITLISNTVQVAAGGIFQNTAQAWTMAAGDFNKTGSDGLLRIGNATAGSSLTVTGDVNVSAASTSSGKTAGLTFGFIPTVSGVYNVGAGAQLGFNASPTSGTGNNEVSLGSGTASNGIHTISNDIFVSGLGQSSTGVGGTNSLGVLTTSSNARYNFNGTVTISEATRFGRFSNYGYNVFNGKITGTAGGAADDLYLWSGGGGLDNKQRFVLNNAGNDYDGFTRVTSQFGSSTLLQMGITDALPETTTVQLDENWATTAGTVRGPLKTGTGTTSAYNASYLELQGTTQTIVGLATTALGADRKVVWGGLSTANGGAELGGTLNLTATSNSIDVGALTGSALLIKNVTVNQIGAGSSANIGAGTSLEIIGSANAGGTTLQSKGVTGTGTLILAGGSGLSTLKVGASPAASWVSSSTPMKLSGAAANNVIDTNGNNATVDAAISDFSGSNGFTKSGDGKLTLTNSNTYSGATIIDQGAVEISSIGSINTSSGVTVAAGAKLIYNSSTTLAVAPVLSGNTISNRSVFGGSGTVGTAVVLDNLGDTLSPGNSPGTLSFTPSQTWSSFSYDWEINSFTGTTAGGNFDLIALGNSLNLTGGSGSYVLNILSLTAGNIGGDAPDFSEIDRSWTLLSSTGITGFDAANWTLNTSGFTSQEGGNWTIGQTGNDLTLTYTAVPEPGGALIGGLGMLALLRRRRGL
ncbi:MAG: hypothetical protein RLZZ245_1488 [Verrucomicrobiota bacterium]